MLRIIDRTVVNLKINSMTEENLMYIIFINDHIFFKMIIYMCQYNVKL